MYRCTTLQKVSVQLCSFAAQLIQFKVMRRSLITVMRSRGMLFLFCLHRLIYHMCLKCLPSVHRRIADEYYGGAAVTKFPTKYFRIEFMRREFVVRVIGTLLVVLYIPYIY